MGYIWYFKITTFEKDRILIEKLIFKPDFSYSVEARFIDDDSILTQNSGNFSIKNFMIINTDMGKNKTKEKYSINIEKTL